MTIIFCLLLRSVKWITFTWNQDSSMWILGFILFDSIKFLFGEKQIFWSSNPNFNQLGIINEHFCFVKCFI